MIRVNDYIINLKHVQYIKHCASNSLLIIFVNSESLLIPDVTIDMYSKITYELCRKDR